MTKPFKACGVITLTTDFGHIGPFVAMMKGMMLQHFANARIIDLTHETDAHFPAEAGFWLTHSYTYFPPGTTHVAVVDPGVGTERDIIGVAFDGHAFLAPDNGLLAPIAEKKGAHAYKLDPTRHKDFGLTKISATFHGRDIFAPLGAKIAAGKLQVSDLGPRTDNVVPSWIEEPTITNDRITGTVVTVDGFGNLITNISEEMIETLRAPIVRAGGRSFDLQRTYGRVAPGHYLALINSLGMVELARAEQSAAEALGLSRGAPVTVTQSSS